MAHLGTSAAADEAPEPPCLPTTAMVFAEVEGGHALVRRRPELARLVHTTLTQLLQVGQSYEPQGTQGLSKTTSNTNVLYSLMGTAIQGSGVFFLFMCTAALRQPATAATTCFGTPELPSAPAATKLTQTAQSVSLLVLECLMLSGPCTDSHSAAVPGCPRLRADMVVAGAACCTARGRRAV